MWNPHLCVELTQRHGGGTLSVVSRTVTHLDDEAAEHDALLTESPPGRVHFDERTGVIEIERQLDRHPWWVYGVLVVHADQLKLVEVRVFPSVERDAYVEARDDVYAAWFAARRKDPAARMPAEDYERLKATKHLRPRYGQWRRTKANLDAAASGMDKTLLARVKPGDLVAAAAAEASYLERLLPGGNDAVVEALAAAPVYGKKGDLYYAKLAREYVALLTRGSKRPLVELAERRGGAPAGWSRDKMRDEIRQCRNRLLLPAVGQHAGRPGSPTLTKRARQILAEDEGDR